MESKVRQSKKSKKEEEDDFGVVGVGVVDASDMSMSHLQLLYGIVVESLSSSTHTNKEDDKDDDKEEDGGGDRRKMEGAQSLEAGSSNVVGQPSSEESSSLFPIPSVEETAMIFRTKPNSPLSTSDDISSLLSLSNHETPHEAQPDTSPSELTFSTGQDTPPPSSRNTHHGQLLVKAANLMKNSEFKGGIRAAAAAAAATATSSGFDGPRDFASAVSQSVSSMSSISSLATYPSLLINYLVNTKGLTVEVARNIASSFSRATCNSSPRPQPSLPHSPPIPIQNKQYLPSLLPLSNFTSFPNSENNDSLLIQYLIHTKGITFDDAKKLAGSFSNNHSLPQNLPLSFQSLSSSPHASDLHSLPMLHAQQQKKQRQNSLTTDAAAALLEAAMNNTLAENINDLSPITPVTGTTSNSTVSVGRGEDNTTKSQQRRGSDATHRHQENEDDEAWYSNKEALFVWNSRHKQRQIQQILQQTTSNSPPPQLPLPIFLPPSPTTTISPEQEIAAFMNPEPPSFSSSSESQQSHSAQTPPLSNQSKHDGVVSFPNPAAARHDLSHHHQYPNTIGNMSTSVRTLETEEETTTTMSSLVRTLFCSRCWRKAISICFFLIAIVFIVLVSLVIVDAVFPRPSYDDDIPSVQPSLSPTTMDNK